MVAQRTLNIRIGNLINDGPYYMTDKKLIRTLKVFIVIGISQILFGHYLLLYTDFTQQNGIMISAGCIALGFAFSLPTQNVPDLCTG